MGGGYFGSMTHEENWNKFIEKLKEYVLKHHHFPDKMVRHHQPRTVSGSGEYEEFGGVLWRKS